MNPRAPCVTVHRPSVNVVVDSRVWRLRSVCDDQRCIIQGIAPVGVPRQPCVVAATMTAIARHRQCQDAGTGSRRAQRERIGARVVRIDAKLQRQKDRTRTIRAVMVNSDDGAVDSFRQGRCIHHERYQQRRGRVWIRHEVRSTRNRKPGGTGFRHGTEIDSRGSEVVNDDIRILYSAGHRAEVTQGDFLYCGIDVRRLRRQDNTLEARFLKSANLVATFPRNDITDPNQHDQS